jgi:hypothetical protein
MYRAWLERLFVTFSRNLVILFLVALVVSVTTIAIIVILPPEVGALEPFRPSVATVVTPVTSFCHVVDLLIKLLAKLMMHIASDVLLDLAFTLLMQRSICNLRIVDVLKVLSEWLERLFNKTPTAFHVLGPVFLMERHVEPLKL